MRVVSIRAFAMILQALLGLVSKTKGFTDSFSSYMKPASSVRFFCFNHHSRNIPKFQGGSKIPFIWSPSQNFEYGRLSFRYASTQLSDNDQSTPEDDKKSSNKNVKRKIDESRKNQLLAAAFDELARKEGFNSTLSYMAEDEKFEDDFIEDDPVDDGEDESYNRHTNKDTTDDNIFDESNFNLSDFTEGKVSTQRLPDLISENQTDSDSLDDNEDDDHDKFLDLGGDDDDDDMEARIAQAKRDMVRGHVSVPEGLDNYSRGATKEYLRKLGFQEESNLYGNDESRLKNTVTLISNDMTCSACGSDFQSRNEQKPGYLQKNKFDLQVKLSKVEEIQNLKKKAESSEWSSEDEIEFLIQTSGKGNLDATNEFKDNIDIDAVIKDLGLDLDDLERKKVICKRCHGLQNSGKVDDSLRPGWTDEPTLSQEQFRELLRPISEKPAVIIALIDLFDFGGSVLRELDGIAADNPVILAANKADLMPSQMGKNRIENWVRRELEYMGVNSIANSGGSVRLVSCKTGDGISNMLDKARELANEMKGDIYVVGAANAGKSTLINYILSRNSKNNKNKEEQTIRKIRPGNRNQLKGALTTSPLPGTTLKFIKIDLGDGQTIYDTPGLLVPGTITQLLTQEELKIVCPKKQIEPITFRVTTGKCVLVGGLAKIEVIGDSKPFLLTFFVANEIKLHPTDSSRADEFTSKHAGKILTPPLEPGPKRMAEIGEFDSHTLEIDGAGWREAAADISLTGLGWIAVTGAGRAKLKISVPKGIGISVRPPLMPFDIWEVAAKYTGAKAVRKASKSKTGKRRKGVGRN